MYATSANGDTAIEVQRGNPSPIHMNTTTKKTPYAYGGLDPPK